jgi:hypothetical protein
MGDLQIGLSHYIDMKCCHMPLESQYYMKPLLFLREVQHTFPLSLSSLASQSAFTIQIQILQKF